jgi:NhaP-type Na+/H+ or K+/H+ antiporter
MTAKELELRTTGLQNVVLYNRVCLLISKKLRDYQRSGANVASYILSLVILLLFAVISFALINYALYKINPALYQFTYSKESFFAFVYYSSGSMFYAANGLVPVEPLSQFVQLIQFLCALLLLVILVTVIFSLRNERYSTQLEEVIVSMETEGRAAEARLLSEFNLDSIDSAIDSLQKAKAGMIGLIIYLTNNLGE